MYGPFTCIWIVSGGGVDVGKYVQPSEQIAIIPTRESRGIVEKIPLAQPQAMQTIVEHPSIQNRVVVNHIILVRTKESFGSIGVLDKQRRPFGEMNGPCPSRLRQSFPS